MKRIIMFLSIVAAMILSFSMTLSAQSRMTVTGTVVDINGEPLIGVAVIEQNTSNGVMTDVDGKYTISVSKSGSLLFDFMGFKQVVKSVGGASR